MNIKRLCLILIMLLTLLIGCTKTNPAVVQKDKYPGFAEETVIMEDGTVFKLYYQEDVWEVSITKVPEKDLKKDN